MRSEVTVEAFVDSASRGELGDVELSINPLESGARLIYVRSERPRTAEIELVASGSDIGILFISDVYSIEPRTSDTEFPMSLIWSVVLTGGTAFAQGRRQFFRTGTVDRTPPEGTELIREWVPWISESVASKTRDGLGPVQLRVRRYRPREDDPSPDKDGHAAC